ncbi:MAG: UDP-N-acetylmuramoyl-L-alanine--D-glutamate ligase [Propionibacteriaceae bacterium]|jgi:UDP-N-acetylmuramoylalanine--D-glutamate ligase|nr:UDP-N-acetylmuramoyl-L-alanine--D-glutamate ligase [Propionibacteriaceae bacterium]
MIELTDRLSSWPAARVLVAGLGRSGFAAADALLHLGAQVTVVDDSDSDANRDKGNLLDILGAETRLGAGAGTIDVAGFDLVVASPGWRPGHQLFSAAAASQIQIWGEVELAWRMTQPDRGVPWLGVTGTNGKTTTVNMLTAMLAADGLRVAEVGNIGRPIIEAILDEEEYDVFAVELSSFQLHWVSTLSLHSAAVLNVQEDHLEWYADDPTQPDPMCGYNADKGRIFQNVLASCVYNVADASTEALVREADVVEGARAVGFTLGTPEPSMLGIVDDLLVDRAFIKQRHDSAIEVAKLSDISPFAPHNVENALAAAALARSFGVHPTSVAKGLRQVRLGDHRIQFVAELGSVRFVDDSKATNPHAAAASLSAFDKVVWIAGGQSKGTNFDELIATMRLRIRAVALLGIDRGIIAAALARIAPEIPVFVIDDTGDSAMPQAVRWAHSQAEPSDVVLLAPGAASLDMYSGYGARGEAFAAAVHELAGEQS